MLQGAVQTGGFPKVNSQENIEGHQVAEEEKESREDGQRISQGTTAAIYNARSGSVESG